MELINFLIVTDLILLSILALFIGLLWLDCYLKRKPNPHPSCFIDPRCHLHFALDKNGNGWIDGKIIMTKENFNNYDWVYS